MPGIGLPHHGRRSGLVIDEDATIVFAQSEKEPAAAAFSALSGLSPNTSADGRETGRVLT
jgi:hypothetical protein